MVETIAFATICFILTKGSPVSYRLKKGAGGAILFIALFQSYTILQPLLPTEVDHLLHSTIWGVLFAYAVPNGTKKTKEVDEEEKGDDDKNDDEPKVGAKEETPPNSTLN